MLLLPWRYTVESHGDGYYVNVAEIDISLKHHAQPPRTYKVHARCYINIQARTHGMLNLCAAKNKYPSFHNTLACHDYSGASPVVSTPLIYYV